MSKTKSNISFSRGIKSLALSDFGVDLTKPLTKGEIIQSFLDTFFKISSKMFEIKGLPDTIPSELVVLKTQLYGFQIIDKVKDNLYSFWASLGGELDYNYFPTKATITNPYLPYNAIRTIDKDCVIIRNDYLCTGLLANHKLFATNIADIFVTLNKSSINARVENIPTATNSNQAEAWRQYFENLEQGNTLGAIVDSNLMKDIKSLPMNSQSMSNMKACIEAYLFLKGAWFNSIGLQASFNNKREYVSEAETGMNDQTLTPPIDEMLDCQRKGWEKVNQMYGTNISVDLGSEWKRAREEKELALEMEKATIQSTIRQANSTPSEEDKENNENDTKEN